MSLRDMLLALAVVCAWGVNFVVIKVGLQGMPPLLLAGLRFLFVAFPAILFIKPPQIPLRWIVSYGLTINLGQFAFLFIALKMGLPAGIASLVSQAQAFFTLLLGALIFSERLRIHHLLAMILATGGIVMLAVPHAGHGVSINSIALLLNLGAALSWGIGNIINKAIIQRYSVNMLSLVVWGAIVPAIGLGGGSFLFEGPTTIVNSLVHIQWHNIMALVYLAGLASIMGYGCWGYLLGRYETWKIAPLSLLVPVVGLISAALLLDEQLNAMQALGTLTIGIALIINLFGARLIGFLRPAHAVKS